MAGAFAWLFASVIIPLCLPFLLLSLLRLPGLADSRSDGILYRSVKDGQLLWASIPLATAACYEAGVALSTVDPQQAWLAWTALVYHFLVALFAAVLVMLWTTVSLASISGTSAGRERAALVRVSFGVAIVTAVTYSLVKLGLAP